MSFVNPKNVYGLQREKIGGKYVRTSFKDVVEKFKGLYIKCILHENNENKREQK